MLVGGRVDSGGSLLAEGGRVETVPLLIGVEEGGQPIPDRRHESPVVLGVVLGGGSRVET